MNTEDEFALAYRSFSLPRAEVIVGMLQSYGINAQLLDRHFNSNNGHLVLATGGYRIMVPTSQLRAANELLKPFHDEDELPESAAFNEKPVRNIFWLALSFLLGIWTPMWLRDRKR